MRPLLLGFFFADTPKYPTVPPELATQLGWAALALVALLGLFAWSKAASFRHSVLALDDPRVFASLRIGVAVMTILCFANLQPYWRMLWSDEGIFDLAYARDRLGRTALRGWSPDEGFFDVWAVANFLTNKPSLFYFWGSPTFVVGYLSVFFVVLAAYAVGLGSRVTGVVAWLMMGGIYDRNSLYLEGTDTVYRCVWFLLLFARTGHAWSVDNWWRMRRLRRRGRADTSPTYRLVPAWPRYLIMLQVCAIYITTGAVKTGNVWKAGDALYYALNMDHFYRFEGTTQWVSSVFGLNLFRINTWVVHWWECLFGLVMVGLILRFELMHRDAPWAVAQARPWRRWLGRAALLGAYGTLYVIVLSAIPYCLEMDGDKVPSPAGVLRRAHVTFGIIVPVAVAIWVVVGKFPMRCFRGGRSLGALTKRWPWLRLPEIPIDQAHVLRYTLGRRVWLTIGVVFHGFLIAFMNIGMFAPIMLTTYVAFLSGEEVRRATRPVLTRFFPERGPRWCAPAAPHEDVPLRGRTIPDAIVLVWAALGLGLVWAKVDKASWSTWATYGWIASILVVACVFRLRPSRGRSQPPALAYGTVGRTLALGLVLWHSGAVATKLFPAYPIFKWRGHAQSPFGDWLRATSTSQSWRMFAPNPPRSNTFMQTLVVLENGERWDLRENAYHYGQRSGPPSRPNPWIINDRMRKMQRRMVGKGKWYLRHWAGFQCREWALHHDGELPREIRIRKITSRIPSPTYISYWVAGEYAGRRDRATGAVSGRPYDPRKLKDRTSDVESHACDKVGELPAWLKQRYGWELTEADHEELERERDKETKKFESRRATWEKRRDYGGSWTRP